jgi:HTH-type transcriptional regulator, transcriptional repressor of NAD biosynthesis genes
MPGTRPTLGVTVGKFNPPHLGHVHLISTGARLVDRLVVLLCDRPDQTIPAVDRAAWLADACPDHVEVVITPDDLPTENGPWAARALELLPAPPDVAVTSEPWGPGWASLMGARHHPVDLDRAAFPTSGTALRADLGAGFEWLVPAARAALARRVVLAGAESTGKTTLAQGLAGALGTVWVPEYGRVYWEGRRHLRDQGWAVEEFVRIARGQQALERDLARRAARGVVIADTDALVTSVWLRRYLERSEPALDDLVAGSRPDLYLVCAPDFDWVQDGTRESIAFREQMHAETVDLARSTGARVEILTGSPDERLARALELVAPLTTFPPLT